MVATYFSPFILNNFVNFNSINLKIGGIIKTYERYLPCKFGKNPSSRTWVMNLQIFPIHSYGKIAYSFLTRALAGVWHDTEEMSPKFVASMYFWPPGGRSAWRNVFRRQSYSVNAKLLIFLYNDTILKLLPLITFLFPVLNYLYLGILEEYSSGILCTKLGKID